MNEDVEEAVYSWMPTLGIPVNAPAGIKDLKGKGIRIAKFTDEATVRFFFPRRTLTFQQRMVKSLAVKLRKRGAKIVSVALTIEDYARWQQQQGEPDSPELRFRFASAPPELG